VDTNMRKDGEKVKMGLMNLVNGFALFL